MKNEIDIIVSSSAGVGKSTIARLIRFACVANDIEVELNDYGDDIIGGDIVDWANRIHSLSEKGVKVNITTTQTRRKNENE